MKADCFSHCAGKQKHNAAGFDMICGRGSRTGDLEDKIQTVTNDFHLFPHLATFLAGLPGQSRKS